jgi:hypothetical protein
MNGNEFVINAHRHCVLSGFFPVNQGSAIFMYMLVTSETEVDHISFTVNRRPQNNKYIMVLYVCSSSNTTKNSSEVFKGTEECQELLPGNKRTVE